MYCNVLQSHLFVYLYLALYLIFKIIFYFHNNTFTLISYESKYSYFL